MHGLWQGHTRRGASAARAARVPYLIAAHGMAEPWALRHKRWKKRSTWHSSSRGTSAGRPACTRCRVPRSATFASLAPWTPICFVPNGVDLESFDDLPARAVLEREHPELAGKFVLLFFGRVHVKKGLDLLAEALATVGAGLPGPAPARGRQGRRRLDAVRRADRGSSGCPGGSPTSATWGASGPGRSGPRPTPSSCPATARASAWPSSRPWPARFPA